LKVLLATDGSAHANAALHAVLGRAWPPGTALRILSVSHPIPLIPDPLLFGAAMHHESVERVAKQADQIVAAAAEEAHERAPGLRVSTVTREGSPRKLIVVEAKRWKADLVVVGSEGHGALRQFLLGSVAHTVALHAPCSVEIVRAPRSALGSNVRPAALRARRSP
jgi:nucleotide-binding universal stress UspA family protein